MSTKDKVQQLRAENKRLADDLEMAHGCLVMIHDDLIALGMEMKGCPPMMYNDAIRSAVIRARREARAAAVVVCDDRLSYITGMGTKGAYGIMRAQVRQIAACLRDDEQFVAALKRARPKEGEANALNA